MTRIKTLADLQVVRQQLAQAEQEREAERQRQAQRQRQQQAQQNLFRAAVGAVKPVTPPPRANLKAQPPQPVPVQHLRDEQAVLKASLSDDFDANSLLETDAGLSYSRPGLGPDVVRKLRRGDWAVQAQLDLHGLRSDDARDALAQFVRDAHKRGLRCVRVVHGKGLGSLAKTPVLKGRVPSWLAQKPQVLAYVQARPIDGGSGALLVLLQPS